jgi:4-amino-4-deoxy-L-arabinose transferase-like glycosyltransferase
VKEVLKNVVSQLNILYGVNGFKVSIGYYYIFAGLLLIPAVFVNLGTFPLMADEPIRGLVSFEMERSQNWMVPTLIGKAYYNKPPLFNWFIILLSKCTGSIDEFTIRLAAVIPFFMLLISVFVFVKRNARMEIAALVTFAVATNARILLYDLTLGHIDFLFSVFIFWIFMVLFEFGNKRKWWIMYPVIYVLGAFAFFLKGLPSLVFIGFSLIAFAVFLKEIRFLFHYAHFVGIFIFMALIGPYYYGYSQIGDIGTLVSTLWSESSKRTVLETSWWDSILHVPNFPIQYLIHFLPWSLFGVFLFRKGFWKDLRANRFLWFSFLIFSFNLVVYWLSPETRPRYIFALFPLFFIIILFDFETHIFEPNWKGRFVGGLIQFILGSILLLHFLLIVFPQFQTSEPLTLFSLFVLLIIVYFSIFDKRTLVPGLVCALIVLRITFDAVVIPYRLRDSPEVAIKATSEKIATLTKGKKLFLPDDIWMKELNAYYISTFRGETIQRSSNPDNMHDYVLTISEDTRFKDWEPTLKIEVEGHSYTLLKEEKDPEY